MATYSQILDEYIDAMARCRRLYTESALADGDSSRELRQRLEELHAGLIVKIYTTVALADRKWRQEERPLAAAMIQHLWGVQLDGEELKQAVIRLADASAKLGWYPMLRPFAEWPDLREHASELEIVTLQLAKLVAAADGPIVPAEQEILHALQRELETHLKPLSLDPATRVHSTTEPPPVDPLREVPPIVHEPPAKGCVASSPSRTVDPNDRFRALLRRLHALTGLTQVKSEVETLANFIRFQQKRDEQGLPTSPLNLHMVFTGNPGTGKTTVARLLGEILQSMGILARGHMIETDRAGLVAEYAGQTAAKTNRLIDSALDGILFIDEAYGLLNRADDAYGHEAIQTLVKRMEDDRHRLVVILAGYEAKMQGMLKSNPGLASRFSRYLHFADYVPDDLLQIFLHFCERNHFEVPPLVRARLICGLTLLYAARDEHFGNGRLVRNIFEDAIRRLANRIAHEPEVSHAALTNFDPGDIAFAAIEEDHLKGRLHALRVLSLCPSCGNRVRQRVGTLGVRVPCPHCRKPHQFGWGEVSWVAGDGD